MIDKFSCNTFPWKLMISYRYKMTFCNTVGSSRLILILSVSHCTVMHSLFFRSISSAVHTVSSLLLCDSPGFQNPASCGRQTGASFEDLCHNYLQERLQLLFHHTTLVAPKDRYEMLRTRLKSSNRLFCIPKVSCIIQDMPVDENFFKLVKTTCSIFA